MRSLLVSRPMADMDNDIIPHAVFLNSIITYYNVCIQIDVATQKITKERNLYREKKN